MLARIAWAAALALTASPASAEVVDSSAAGFVVRQSADVSASPEAVWSELLKPAGWWSGQHSYSGNAANLSIDPRAGGCFCEVLPSAVSPRAAPRGSVEHMRVLYAEQARVLRLSGGLGPLQSEATQGTLTIALRPIDGGTRIMWEYVVGGYIRQKVEQIAPAVDAVLGEQISRLAVKLGPRPQPRAPAAPPRPDPSQPGR
jgi:hypothetical protein